VFYNQYRKATPNGMPDRDRLSGCGSGGVIGRFFFN